MKDIEKLGNYKMQMIEAVFGKRQIDLVVTLQVQMARNYFTRWNDRVDTYNADGKVYVNIIDYKSSARDLRKPDVLNGVG